jgi:hypothetical protein
LVGLRPTVRRLGGKCRVGGNYRVGKEGATEDVERGRYECKVSKKCRVGKESAG